MKNMSLRVKLLVAFLAVGLIPFGVIAAVSYVKSSGALSQQAFGQLEGVRGIKKNQIENFFKERRGDMGVLVEMVATLQQEAFKKLDAIQQIKRAQIEGYFQERMGDISVLSKNDLVSEALNEFDAAYEAEGKKIGGSFWKSVEEKFGPWLTHYQKEYGYYDLFLISKTGDVVYTTAKESDLGGNLGKR